MGKVFMQGVSPVLRVPAHIYGVAWDGSSTTTWTRTDEAADFADPVPYVAGAAEYSSPFDNIMPWSGMVRSTDPDAGEVVAIPKFWYLLEQTSGNGLSIKIADRAVPGYSVSPAHMDRSDGEGERDIVYIGRYHSATGTYKSTTGVKPQGGVTRSDARTNIHALGNDIWQADFALRFTVWLLYLVEFADWNSQAKIGYGCGNNSAPENMGYSDDMPYHTGTTLSARTTYGLGTQYRYIEGLWDNVFDWCDGCRNSDAGLSLILDPSEFSDTAGGISVGTPSSGYPGVFSVTLAAGFPVFYPVATGGSDSTFSCDYWSFSASNPCVYAGGDYSQVAYHGLFCVNGTAVSDADANIGSRLMILPAAGG